MDAAVPWRRHCKPPELPELAENDRSSRSCLKSTGRGLWEQPDWGHINRLRNKSEIHWYVPPELAELDQQATASPERERDKWAEMAVFNFK